MTISTRKNNSGFTLVEVLIASSISVVVLCAIMCSFIYFTKSFATLTNYTEMNRKGGNAMDVLSQRIRQTRTLLSFTPTKLVFRDFDTNTLTYTYDPTAFTLTQTDTNGDKVLLTQCDSLTFGMSRRNPTNDFQFYPATLTNTAKIISVTWKTSREIMGAKVNTENVQTTRIVIRN